VRTWRANSEWSMRAIYHVLNRGDLQPVADGDPHVFGAPVILARPTKKERKEMVVNTKNRHLFDTFSPPLAPGWSAPSIILLSAGISTTLLTQADAQPTATMPYRQYRDAE
jgi:hypothetical protein